MGKTMFVCFKNDNTIGGKKIEFSSKKNAFTVHEVLTKRVNERGRFGF